MTDQQWTNLEIATQLTFRRVRDGNVSPVIRITDAETVCRQMRDEYEARITAILAAGIEWKRNELIVCPSCDAQQMATVTKHASHPWPSYVHTCEACGYVIMESEWQATVSPDVV